MVKIKGKRNISNKNNILIKYDKNNDGIVSLEEYLAEEISLGPRANPSRINYNYQDYENIFNYFMIVFLKFKKFKIMCVPNFILKYQDYVNRTALAYHVKDNKIYHSNHMRQELINCSRKDNVRFIFFTLIIIWDNKTELTHANIVIIDLLNRTYERFEPYGNLSKNIENKLDNLFDKKVREILSMKSFKYIPPCNISPFVGIQKIADSYCGMCITISMMYLHMRILNPDLSQKKLVKFIINRPKNKLKVMILKYARHVEETLKEHEITVINMFDDLYEQISNQF